MTSLARPPAPSTLTTSPLHAASPAGPWWRDAVIYQVYPRSFADADGDGIGDLPGITARLDHLAELGVDAVWLSPFYRSPQRDAGYDVADYRDVDPLFGTLADADALLARAHALGLRVIVDLVPNHTSSEHPWFRAARTAAPGSPERGRYLFRDGRGPAGDEPPNNWTSVFGGSAWTRVTEPDGTPGQWYLHLFDPSQPDLDWSNPEVRAEFEDVLRFWLDRGVDGFRVDVAHGMVKAPGLPDWHGTTAMIDGGHDGTFGSEDGATGAGSAGPMWDQEPLHEIYRAWNGVLAQYAGDRALVAEAWVEPMSRLARYVRPGEMHQAFNFAFLTTLWSAPDLRAVIVESLEANDEVGAPTTWVLSNHDVVRHTSRLGLEVPGSRPNGIGATDPQPDEEVGLRRGRAASLLMLGLPGSAYVYQGEELGLPEHTTLADEERQDPAWWRSEHTERGRDGCRVPLPWAAAEAGYGFSPTGATWLTQPDSFARYAADVQRGVPGSTYELYRTALRVRREQGLGTGSLAWADGLRTEAGRAVGEDVLAFVNRDVLVVATVGEADVVLPPQAVPLVTSGPTRTTADGRVVVPADTTVWALLTD
ncbi:MAG: glycoside hydrolase family 13 protein [Actinotalea sp.]|nr:glycoside hydrolase family 13 protein [Actinotalea sp.]